MTDKLLSVRETAQRLGVHENTVRNWVASGMLRSARLPGARFHKFEVAEIERVAKARGRPVVEPLQTTRRVPELADPEQVVQRTPKRRPSPATTKAKKPELVDAADLSVWAGRRETQGLFPKLVRRLLVATPEVTELSIIRSEEGVSAPGWDGLVNAKRGSLWVPSGRSGWELGTDSDVRSKAQADYSKRSGDPLGLDPSKTTFVFATPRRWSGAEKWERERKAEGLWRDVRVIDAERLEAWLEATPAVHYWLSEELGLRPRDALTLERWWDHFASRTKPRLPPSLLLAGRDKQVEELTRFLEGPPQVSGLQAGARSEAIGFFAAAQAAADEELQRGAVVVRSEPVWARLSESLTPMVLIADFEDPAVGAALEAGHHVITPLGREDIVRGQTIELPRIHRLAAQEALQQVGISFEEADQLAGLARRSLTSFIRRRAVDPRMSRPRWGEGEAALILAPLMLAGAWSGNTEDRSALEEIVDAKRDAIEANVRRWSATEDPPFTRSGSGWHLTSPEEAFDVLHGFLTPATLDRWQRVALAVLSEPDPEIDLSEEERFSRLNRRPETHSEALRRGLAKSLALLGTLGTDKSPDDTQTFSDRVDAVLRELLAQANADESGLLWRSLSDELPLIAEAAPRVFLDAVDVGLTGTAPLLATMFRDTPDQSFFFASSPHTGLLWALETLCWSSDLLPEVLLALARLASIDPGGRLGNRPAGSLRAVLLPWIPYTSASTKERLAAFRQVRKRYPKVAWPLLLSLMPKLHDHSSPTSSPRFRDWKPDREGVTMAEWATTVEALVAEASEMLREEPARWIEIPEHVGGLPVHLRHRLLDEMTLALQTPKLDDEQRLDLWRTVTQVTEHHREFPAARWVMDEESLVKLEATAATLAPDDPVTRNAKLFDWRPILPSPTSRSNREDYDQELAQLQREVVSAVWTEDGLDGIRRLAEASPQAHFVGHALAGAIGETGAGDLVTMIGLSGKEGEMARGWLRRLVSLREPGWPLSLKNALLTLEPDTQAQFLNQLPSGPDLESLLADVDEAARDKYWRIVHPFTFDDADAAMATRELIVHDRPAEAVELLSLRLHDGKAAPNGVTAKLITDALRAVLAAPDESSSVAGFTYSVGLLIDRLGDLGASDQEIAQLEWAFFPMLEHSSHPPKALFAALKEEPSFFVELVSLVYRGKTEQPRELDGATAAAASNAWSVLNAWRDLPGHSDDGSIDRTHLHRWVRQARLMLDERDRADIGDEQIGQMLSGSPTGSDGAWPAEPVRELIEDIGSRELETGLHIGKVNSRGVTTRGMLDGGEQERAIAEGYRAWAKITRGDWPRTTRLLNSLAESYDRDAQRFDAEAEARGNRD